jgi:predicted O-linked N-acetylglucosamine transferase (SPINDLY family)
LGNVLRDLGSLDEAIASYRKALALRPDLAGGHNNLGVVLKDLGRLEEAAASYRAALAITPDFTEAHSNLIYTLKFMAETSSAEIKAEADRLGEIVRSRADPFTSWKVRRDPEKRLRVGLVSGDFRNHVIGRYLDSFQGHIDPSEVEFAAYSTAAREDEMTARLKLHFALWHKVMGLDDKRLAGMIHGDGVDILIDLAGHTAGNRLPMFAYKPAPVQATWLGLFATTGVPGIDYIIADPHLAPDDEAPYFCEEIWPLAESWFCLNPPNFAIEPGPLPALDNGYVTFACFNNLTKMTDDVVALWARVLRAVSGSRLFLKANQLQDEMAKEETLARFAVHGIAPQRLVLEGSSPLEEYFAAYHRVDVALDPFPFHGATTSLDGLWMAVPVLTRRGQRVGAHLGESIARNAGLADWIADDDDDYVTKAVALTSDLQRLAGLRAGLRAQVLASPLYDGQRFARHFEKALRGMWRKACGD